MPDESSQIEYLEELVESQRQTIDLMGDVLEKLGFEMEEFLEATA